MTLRVTHEYENMLRFPLNHYLFIIRRRWGLRRTIEVDNFMVVITPRSKLTQQPMYP
jgi:hypothetical protein